MTNHPHGILLILLLCWAQVVQAQPAPEKIRVLYEHGVDSIGGYCMGMLELALSRIDHNYEIEPVPGEHSSARSIELVLSGHLDLIWASANRQIEQQLLPVRIPLYKGLLGHRILLIRPDNQHRFAQMETLADLEDLSFGQGTTWADAEILEHNGLQVIRVNKYANLFPMLEGNRFDAFPRGIQEPWGELASRPELNLTVEQRLMLVYRMPFYLFVGPDKPELAADIERGLNLAIADGSFDEYFFNHPTIKDALQRANLQNRTVIELDNPTLPPKTPLDREELWIDPGAL